MNTCKNIVILTPGFPKDENDYLCIPPLQLLTRQLIKNTDIKLSIIAFQYPYENKNYKWNTVTVYSCGGNNKSFPSKFFTWQRAVKYFKQINKIQKVDIVHSFWLNECALIGEHLITNIYVH